MKIRKSIAHAYPKSWRASELGVYENGCFYVAQSFLLRTGLWSGPRVAIGFESEIFAEPDDPDLIALFFECDGEPCPTFLKYGDSRALAAIAKLEKHHENF